MLTEKVRQAAAIKMELLELFLDCALLIVANEQKLRFLSIRSEQLVIASEFSVTFRKCVSVVTSFIDHIVIIKQ